MNEDVFLVSAELRACQLSHRMVSAPALTQISFVRASCWEPEQQRGEEPEQDDGECEDVTGENHLSFEMDGDDQDSEAGAVPDQRPLRVHLQNLPFARFLRGRKKKMCCFSKVCTGNWEKFVPGSSSCLVSNFRWLLSDVGLGQ